MRRLSALLLFVCLAAVPANAQKSLSGTAAIKKSLDRLNTLGTVLMIAAHPDDENTALLTYFARGRNLRTGYLSLTRGEGGQNLIGAEQGDKIGIIRTQELLAARRVDGGEQMFSRMVDFGFSKNAAETITNWGRDRVLADIVWTIRRFQPDVIVLRFSGTPRDGHGHHQTSAILGKDAFRMAADPAAFPDQLRFVQPWQAKRLYFNLFNWSRELEEQNEKAPNTLAMDYGTYDPVLGFSYTEIAGMSRSQHRSQGMGSPERKGASRNHLELLAGEPAANDPFDGIETSWSRLEGGAAIGKLISEAIAQFQPEQPHRIVPLLAQARQLIAARSDAWSKRKLTEIDETIALCAGIWADASSDRAELVPGSTAKVTVSVINRSPLPAAIVKASVAGAAKADLPLEPNKMASIDLEWKVPAEEPLSQPYWLRAPKDGPRYAIARQELVGLPENPPLLVASIVAKVSGVEIELTRPLHYRYVDRADGELVRPVAVVPAVAVSLAEKVYLFPSPAPRNVEVTLLPKQPRQTVQLSLKTPPGWNVEPRVIQAELGEANAQQSFTFRLTPGASPRKGKLEAQLNGQAAFGIDVIRYPHIPPQTLFPPADAELVPVTVTTLSKNIGYIMGAGDDVPDSLRQLGCTVTLLSSEDLSHGDLSRFDAIVTGVRAFNTRIDLRANQGRLFQYVKEGGTMLVQYNVADSRFWAGGQSLGKTVGPFPLEVGAGRVTDENAAVETLTASPLLQKPNAIVADDWKGWVQERGLYYPATWDPQYQPLFRMADPGEKPQDGSTLVARYGKGVYIYTALSWFRQLPAGVPGAYRIFANLLSASKIQ